MADAVHYRKDVDGLRAIAVGSVVLNHFYEEILPSGYLGVDIFFVISGYVITISIIKQNTKSVKDLITIFYLRRFKRIMPALVLCVLVTSLIISLFNPDPGKLLKTGIASIFGISNFYLLKWDSDYFGELSRLNPFTHTWSLGVEEQFYLIFPLSLWLFLKAQSDRKFKRLYAAVAAVSVLSLLLFAWVGASRPMVSFYLMPFRFWELATGCLIAVRHSERGWAQSVHRFGGENIVLILILAVLFVPKSFSPFTSVAIVALAAAAIALLSPGSVAYRVMTSRTATYLGLISYSLYLWHWPVLVLSRYTIGFHWWALPIIIGLVFLTTHISYYKVERPLRASSWGPTQSREILIGGAVTFVAAGLLLILAMPLNGRLYVGTPAELEARNVDSLSYPYHVPQTSYQWAGTPCVLSNNAEAGRDIPLNACTLGRFGQASRRIMIFGNSFSAAFVHGFDALVRDDHYAVTITSSWSASPIGEIPNDSHWSKINEYYWNNVVPRMVSRLRRGDQVVLMSDIAQLAPAQADPKAEWERKLFEVGLRRFSSELSRAGVRLVVLDVNPFIRDSGCKPDAAVPQWFAFGAPPCKFFSKAETIARRQPVDSMLRRLERERRLAVIDLLDLLCPRQSCTFLGADNQVLYRDEFSHPSVEAVHTVAPLLRHLLTSRSWPMGQQDLPSSFQPSNKPSSSTYPE
ncbi:acyltransferase family protein [Sphingomonas melonis]